MVRNFASRLLWLAPVIAMVVALVLTGCGGSSGSTPNPSNSAAPKQSSAPASSAPAASSSAAATDELVAAAKKEGVVQMYMNAGFEQVLDELAARFEKKYGVKMKYTVAGGSATYQKITMERSSGQRYADFVIVGATTLASLNKDGAVESFQPENAKYVDKRFFGEKPIGVPVIINEHGILVNSSVDPKSITSWKDFLDPKWAGRKFSIINPSIAGSGFSGWFIPVVNSTDLGEDFHKQLAKQDPLIMDNDTLADAALARGEISASLAGMPKAVAAQQGAGLQFIVPKEGVDVSPINGTIIQGAPHPNAAKLWFNYLLSEEAQSLFEQITVVGPARLGVAKRPEFQWDKMKFLPPVLQQDPNTDKQYADQAKQIYKLQ